MVSSASRAIAAILIIFGSALHAHSQTGLAAKAPTATISGRVTIKDKGARGIVVGLRLIDNSTPVRNKAVTDDQGNYKIVNVAPGYYQVVAVAPVYVSTDELSRGKTVLINKDETVENVDIALVRGGVITGKVTDPDGRPVIEEEISAYPVETNRPIFYTTLGLRTDDRGVYRIFGLPAGHYRVAAGLREDEAFDSTRAERASYRLTYHPAAADISQASIIEVTEGSEATNVDITLSRPVVKYSARGRIVDGVTGRPVPNMRYGLHMTISETSSASMSTGAASNSEGEFKFQNLTPGKYAVYIEPEPESEWRADAVSFDVIDQDVAGLIVRIAKGASVSGVMVLEGTDDAAVQASLSKVRLHAMVSGDDSPNVSGHSSNIVQNGNFRIGGLKAGTLSFAVSSNSRFQIVRVERNGIVYPKGIGIKEGEELSGFRVVLNYGNGTIRGTVKPESGTFPRNASMFITLRKLGEQSDSGYHSTRVDTRGEFLIEGLLPGNYEVSATVFINDVRIPARQARQQVVVTDGTTNVTLTVDLSSTPNRP